MTNLEAILYGIVQGLTEFLPVSSSAHLAIFHWLQGNPNKEMELAFDVALHFGTLIPVFIYFWKDWYRLITGFWDGMKTNTVTHNPDARMLIYLIVATIPGAIIGKLLEDKAATVFRAPWVIASMMCLMGLVLYYADRKISHQIHMNQMKWKEVLMIGFSQALAIIPGVSRSGVTMTTGLFCHLDRETAARFSFLLSAPIIAGAAMVKIPELIKHGIDSTIILGILSAGVVGWLAIAGLLRYVQKRSFVPFVVYRLVFAMVVFYIYLTT